MDDITRNLIDYIKNSKFHLALNDHQDLENNEWFGSFEVFHINDDYSFIIENCINVDDFCSQIINNYENTDWNELLDSTIVDDDELDNIRFDDPVSQQWIKKMKLDTSDFVDGIFEIRKDLRTNNLKKEIDDFVSFIENNRERSYKFFQDYYGAKDQITYDFDGEVMDFNPDKQALILSTLSFDDNGQILRSVSCVEDEELYENTFVDETETYDHEEIKEYFNKQVENFNESQDKFNKGRKRSQISYDISLNAQMLSKCHNHVKKDINLER